MKAIHVVRQFHPSVGGLEAAVLQLCGALRSRGVAAEVVTLDRISNGSVPGRLSSHALVEGIPVRRIPFRGSWRYPLAPDDLAQLRRADVVHVHGIDFFVDFLAATRALHRKPLIASTHGGFFHTRFARRLKQVYFHTATRAAASAYSAICASSESDFALFRPVAGRRLVLAPNGVDIRKWSGLGRARPVRRLITIGRFSSNKNIGALIELLAALRLRHPDWTLTIAGQPSDVPADVLRAQARQAGVAEAVTIIEAPSDEVIAEAIGTASYIASASRHEGFGIGIVEGLSAGLVPVLSPIAPFAKLLGEARCGRLIEVDDPVASAATVESLHAELCRDPHGTRAAAMEAAERYSWDGTADLILGCYEAAVFRRRAAVPVVPLRSSP